MNENDVKKYGFSAFFTAFSFFWDYMLGVVLYSQLWEQKRHLNNFQGHVALIAGIAVAMLFNKKVAMTRKVDIFCENAGNSGVMMIVLIYLLAGGFQGAAAVMGGKESVINMGLTLIPGFLLIPGVFIMCCFISTAIGTSMGTIAAMAPIAVGVAQTANLNVALTCAAVIGGAYFGDNLSMISDTTISAAKGCGSEMKDKFKMNFFIAAPAAIIACIMFGVLGGAASIGEVGAFSIILVIPYIVVLITALMGFNVAGVLFIGIIMTGLIGIVGGTCTFFQWVQAIGEGMSDMFSISIVAILVSGIIGLVTFNGGVEWMVKTATSKIKDRKGAEYVISLLSGVLSAALVNNTIAIIISAPIAKEIGAKYKIAPKRLASLIDIFACAFLSLMPHDGGMLIMTGLVDVSPLSIIKYSFYTFALIIAAVITIQFGLLRTQDEKAAPQTSAKEM